MCVCICHFAVWQKWTEHCKSPITIFFFFKEDRKEGSAGLVVSIVAITWAVDWCLGNRLPI